MVEKSVERVAHRMQSKVVAMQVKDRNAAALYYAAAFRVSQEPEHVFKLWHI